MEKSTAVCLYEYTVGQIKGLDSIGQAKNEMH